MQGAPAVLLIFLEKTIELLSSSATDAQDGEEPLQLEDGPRTMEGDPVSLMLPYPISLHVASGTIVPRSLPDPKVQREVVPTSQLPNLPRLEFDLRKGNK